MNVPWSPLAAPPPTSLSPDHTTLPFLSFSRPSTHPSPPPCFVSWSTAGHALPPPTSPRPPSLIVLNVVQPGFHSRGSPKAATFARLTGSSSPVLGSASTDDQSLPPANHPPVEIPSPPPFSTQVEPSRTFSELSSHHEFHTATVDSLLRLAVETIDVGFCSDHRGFMPPSSPCHGSRRPEPPPSPVVWPPATTACHHCGCYHRTATAIPRLSVAYLRGFDSNPTTLMNPNDRWMLPLSLSSLMIHR